MEENKNVEMNEVKPEVKQEAAPQENQVDVPKKGFWAKAKEAAVKAGPKVKKIAVGGLKAGGLVLAGAALYALGERNGYAAGSSEQQACLPEAAEGIPFEAPVEDFETVE